MSLRRWSVVLLLVSIVAPAGAQAQSRFTVGAAGVYGQPVGEFAQNVRRAFGIDGFGTLAIDPRGILSLRGELGYQQYGSKSERFLLSSGFGTIELESETKSGVLTGGIGPQLMAPSGAVRPYIAGTVGFARFGTSTSISVPAERSNTGEKEELDSQDISSDFILSLAGSAGLAFEVPAFGRGVLIDVGARYHHNGRAKYVSPEGVVYNGAGRVSATATESETSFVAYRIGIVVPIR